MHYSTLRFVGGNGIIFDTLYLGRLPGASCVPLIVVGGRAYLKLGDLPCGIGEPPPGVWPGALGIIWPGTIWHKTLGIMEIPLEHLVANFRHDPASKQATDRLLLLIKDQDRLSKAFLRFPIDSGIKECAVLRIRQQDHDWQTLRQKQIARGDLVNCKQEDALSLVYAAPKRNLAFLDLFVLAYWQDVKTANRCESLLRAISYAVSNVDVREADYIGEYEYFQGDPSDGPFYRYLKKRGFTHLQTGPYSNAEILEFNGCLYTDVPRIGRP